ncbi:hypothetical protein ABK040_016859 [Willaertia magna]
MSQKQKEKPVLTQGLSVEDTTFDFKELFNEQAFLDLEEQGKVLEEVAKDLEEGSKTERLKRIAVSSKSPKKAPRKPIIKGRIKPGIRKKRRFKPGTVALREIRKLQNTTNLIIPKRPFSRLVREIALRKNENIRFKPEALLALQEAAEYYITQVLENANLCAIHAKRVTLMKKDIDLVKMIVINK